jgi:steroid delta-isomerase-like uncharacterized protein
MNVEENIGLMKRWFHEVWNEGKIQTVYELMSPDGIARGQGDAESEIHGAKEFAAFVETIHAAFSGMRMVMEDSFGVADKVVVRWSATMVHTGEAFGVPATGKPVHITGITIARIKNGQIVEGWDSWSQHALFGQIGAYKQPDTPLLQRSA